LQEPIRRWLAEAPDAPGAVIEILDSFAYELDLGEAGLQIPEGKHLEIRAADRQRPVVELKGDAHFTLARHASLTINGLWMWGGDVVAVVDPSGPAAVSLVHATLVPRTEGRIGSSLRVEAPEGAEAPVSVSCTVLRCVTGALKLGGLGAGCLLDVRESIVDDQAGTAIDHGGVLRIQASTVLGRARAGEVELASDALFTGVVTSERRQTGCVRFSYLPPGSEVPPRFQCQPQLPEGADEVARESILYRLAPRFTTSQYGQPGYCQLVADLPDEILRGASDQGEMGAFNHLEQSQRRLNLQTALNEHLRVGLDVALVFVT
jgi:hypothetical protein